jgi:MFS family permease
MDITPRFAGTASGLMNIGTALAAIISPPIFGWVIDATGNWTLPFLGTMTLMALGCIMAFRMHPERPFMQHAPHVPAGGVGVAARHNRLLP